MMLYHQPFKLIGLWLWFCSAVALPVHLHALNVGAQKIAVTAQSEDCSRQCESDFCTEPPFLRYGKYCGLLYSGCPGEKPCDDLDACCMNHDACIGYKSDDYLSQECTRNLLECMNRFKNSREHTFRGNQCQVKDVVAVITDVMEAALLLGSIFKNP